MYLRSSAHWFRKKKSITLLVNKKVREQNSNLSIWLMLENAKNFNITLIWWQKNGYPWILTAHWIPPCTQSFSGIQWKKARMATFVLRPANGMSFSHWLTLRVPWWWTRSVRPPPFAYTPQQMGNRGAGCHSSRAHISSADRVEGSSGEIVRR